MAEITCNKKSSQSYSNRLLNSSMKDVKKYSCFNYLLYVSRIPKLMILKLILFRKPSNRSTFKSAQVSRQLMSTDCVMLTIKYLRNILEKNKLICESRGCKVCFKSCTGVKSGRN